MKTAELRRAVLPLRFLSALCIFAFERNISAEKEDRRVTQRIDTCLQLLLVRQRT